MSSGKRLDGSRGIVLLFVLWMTVLLSIIAASFSLVVLTGTRMTADLLGTAQAEALAVAGVNFGIFELLRQPGDMLPDTDGSYLVSFGDGEIEVWIVPENAKIDLNSVSPEFLQGLFRAVSNDHDAKTLAGAVIDWRDQDSDRMPDGAEDPDYRTARLQYGARDGPFLTTGELSQVIGMTEGLFQQLRENITVYSSSTQADPETASRNVLLAVPDIDPADVDKFLAARKHADSGAAKDVYSYLRGTERYLSRSPASVYTITAKARTAGGVVAIQEAIIRLIGSQNNQYEVISWSRSAGQGQPTERQQDPGHAP